MNSEGTPYTLAFLTGGRSRRFGSDKSLLCLDGKPVLETLKDRFGDLFAETLAVSDRPGKIRIAGIREITDRIPDRGPLGGLHAALLEAHTPYLLLMACDLPDVNRETVQLLLNEAQDRDADCVVPHHADGFEPMCSVFHARVLPEVEALLLSSMHRPGPLELYERIRVEYVETENCFFNLNTREDAEMASAGIRPGWRPHKERYIRFFDPGTEKTPDFPRGRKDLN